MRQVAIDAASIPKDAKIAALEKTSAESEKLIADARSDKMKQFEEMQNAQVIIIQMIHFFFVSPVGTSIFYCNVFLTAKLFQRLCHAYQI